MNSTILICDDHPMMREALAATIAGLFPGGQIIEAGTFPDAWAAANDTIQLCICDLVMPGADPIAGISALRSAMPNIPLLVVTGSNDDDLMLALLHIGVSGFLSKVANGRTIRAAIDLIMSGERYVPARLLELMAAPKPPAPAGTTLSAQQTNVMRLVSRGLTNKEVARELSVAPSTVKTHLDAAFRLLGARNRYDAVERARTRSAIG